MDQVPRLVYIVVFDNGENKNKKKKSERTPTTLYFRYTPPILQTTLQLMGCKARHAFKISRRVFEVMMRDIPGNAWPDIGMEVSSLDDVCGHNEKENGCSTGSWFGDEEADSDLVLEKDDKCSSKPFEFCKRRMSVAVERETFLDVVCGVLAEYKYVGPTQRADFILACRIRERKESVTVLLCGASGCGKSTLSSLLGSRLGITTVISTDSIRHMMRSFVDEEQNPLLWASTYQAGDYLDPMAVAEAKAKKKMKNVAQVFNPITDNEVSDEAAFEKPGGVSLSTSELISAKQMVIEGFKAQSKMVISSLDRLIAAWEERKESVVVEGVHLSLNFVMELMKKHPSVIPFLIYIGNEGKHLERFAVRAKYMALGPVKNKYLCKWADKHLVPKINNTNADRSVTIIHTTVLSCLRRRKSGEYLYNPTTDTVPLIDEEYRNQCAANSLSSKRMFQLIKRKGSSRHLMALINTDGSVEKAWPLNTDHGNGISMYGRSLIGKAETINLQFGHYGLSAWSSDIGGSSQILSADDWSTDGAESGSRYNEPIGEMKERRVWGDNMREGLSHGSIFERERERDRSEKQNYTEKDMEGSVDEESAMSDEEYENLAIRDSCWFDG
ncbi:hypothetical protein LOK49_LG10G01667 [Camellia lanceoleosa]|uniref:Uncharacterized protein n=1 Tax=Camellia lanceoleosa TaxID=1840588 RepID=A0ACC0GBZ2_9ERIC|nr:hypothetical protein LOK49_LG10G01667 [Camellia lanceoleosa]